MLLVVVTAGPMNKIEIGQSAMRVTLTVSTGAKIVVWRDQELFSACRAGSGRLPETCLAVDLFEVLAELTGLDLDRHSDPV